MRQSHSSNRLPFDEVEIQFIANNNGCHGERELIAAVSSHDKMANAMHRCQQWKCIGSENVNKSEANWKNGLSLGQGSEWRIVVEVNEGLYNRWKCCSSPSVRCVVRFDQLQLLCFCVAF